MQQWEMEVVDVERAFLYDILDEETFMMMPEGLKVYLKSTFEDEKWRLLELMENDMGFSKCLCLLQVRLDELDDNKIKSCQIYKIIK